MTTRNIRIGDTVSYTSYGEARTAVVTSLSSSGEIIFIRSDRGIDTFVHRISVN